MKKTPKAPASRRPAQPLLDAWLVAPVIFVVSFSVLVFQIAITRVFSAAFVYHYVFLVISGSIFGLGLGAFVAYHSRRIGTSFAKDPRRALGVCGLTLSLSYLTITAIIFKADFLGGAFPYIVLAIAPFVVCGILFSMLFKHRAGESPVLYCADLAGSGLGCLAVAFLIDSLGMVRTFLSLSALVGLLSLLFILKSSRVLLLTNLVSLAILTGLFASRDLVDYIERNCSTVLTAPDKLIARAARSGQKVELVYSKWNSFSRTDVLRVEELSDSMLVTIDGTSNAPMLAFDGSLAAIEPLKRTVEYVPFAIGRSENVAIVGPGGGRDVLLALISGSKRISAAEINSSSIEAVRHFSHFNGGIYDRPGVSVFDRDGRTFIGSSKSKYDLIYLALVLTEASDRVGLSMSENYIYTKEAMAEYLDHLADGGRIAFVAHEDKDFFKISTTAMSVLKSRGVKEADIPQHVALINVDAKGMGVASPDRQPVVIIKKAPFTREEAGQISDWVRECCDVPVAVGSMGENQSFNALRSGAMDLDEYKGKFSYNVEPATDDKPFFFNFGYLNFEIPLAVLGGACVLAAVLFLPSIARRKAYRPAVYFGAIAVAFIMIEIAVVQKFILYLEHPTVAFSVILCSLLAGGGAGSRLSGMRFAAPRPDGRHRAFLAVFVFALMVLALFPVIIRYAPHFPLPARICAGAALVLPLGFFMGMPFPAGIRKMDALKMQGEIPLMWGVNGVMTVAGSALAVIVSMTAGFNVAIMAGALIYLLLYLFSPMSRV